MVALLLLLFFFKNTFLAQYNKETKTVSKAKKKIPHWYFFSNRRGDCSIERVGKNEILDETSQSDSKYVRILYASIEGIVCINYDNFIMI